MKGTSVTRLAAALLFLCAASGLLPAQQPKYGGTLRLATSTLDTSDPHRHTGSIGVQQVYAEGLTSIADDGSVKPFLAERYQISPDGKTYTFFLRRGVKFHNGTEMTATEVVANIERVQKLAKGWLAGAMKLVTSATARDRYTVVVGLSAPYAPFLNLLSELWILSPASEGWAETITRPTGTGPFLFGEWNPNVELKAPKHREYWQKGLPHLDALYFDLTDSDNRDLKLRSGDRDVVGVGANQDKIKKLLEEGYVIEPFKDTSWYFWSFNNRNPRPPFDDPRVREAISYALDKPTLMQVVAGDKGIVTNQMVIPGNFYFDRALHDADKHKRADFEKARRMLRELGVDPSKITMKFVSWQGDAYAEVCLEMVKRLGFKANYVALDDLGTQNELGKYDWDMNCMSSGGRADVFLRYVRFMSDGPNPVLWGGVQDPVLDGLINKGVTTVDDNQRRQAYLQAWNRIMEKYYSVVIGHVAGNLAMSTRVKGLHPGFTASPNRVDGGVAFAWLDR